MKNFEGEVWGVIGIQVKMDAYDRLIPSPVIEEPYQLSLISLYDHEFNRIWEWGCRGDDCQSQDIEKANPVIEKACFKNGQFVEWNQPRKFLLIEDPVEIPPDVSEWPEEKQNMITPDLVMRVQT